ncbi:DUF4261 domain-containing protein [Cytobacillus suaedae]|nr:DUF4261 domain-containing protein [Cytobacillus suaedae]
MRDIVDVGAGILKFGGIAVKIESSGIAHSRDTWLKLSERKEYFPLYSHFVTLIGADDCYYSCGMKVFGLPDIVTPSTISPEDASELLNNFNLYHMVENPTFKSGDTFSIGENTPILKISKLEDFRYNEEDIFFNQFGLLDLSPLE